MRVAVGDGGGQPDMLEKLADALVTNDLRAFARIILEERAAEGGKIEEILPYRVGMHLLETEAEAKRREAKEARDKERAREATDTGKDEP